MRLIFLASNHEPSRRASRHVALIKLNRNLNTTASLCIDPKMKKTIEEIKHSCEKDSQGTDTIKPTLNLKILTGVPNFIGSYDIDP